MSIWVKYNPPPILQYDFWLSKINESKLPEEEINKLKEHLTGTLKEEQKVENYLKRVNANIETLREQQQKAKDRNGKLKREKVHSLIRRFTPRPTG
jgi:peptidoglycan hydrolase CwlO-like protein